MDPDRCLAEIRLLISQSETASNQIAAHNFRELAEKITSLDEWLKLGGFLPSDWSFAAYARDDIRKAH